jgi:hypothetical protein
MFATTTPEFANSARTELAMTEVPVPTIAAWLILDVCTETLPARPEPMPVCLDSSAMELVSTLSVST